MTSRIPAGTLFRSVSLISCALALLLPNLVRAQVSNDNPTGPAGVFNGNVTTGCSYDPFSGNATRSGVTDLVVAGGVSAYPLAFTRAANSRGQSFPDFQFGAPGSWQHSYAWAIDGSETHSQSFSPTVYPVSFPDGRVIAFTASASDSYFRGPPGVRERFQPINFSTMLAYLILPDGGKVEFKATPNVPTCDPELHPPCTFSYSYQAQAIIDPYGMRTTLTYNSDGSLNTIQEPGQRWIQLVYVTTPWANPDGSHDRVIDHLLASDGRIVQYNYGQTAFAPGTLNYTYLGNVVYYPDPSVASPPTAFYTYQAPNVGNANGYPLLSSASDPMYQGPMKNISYTYATGVNGDNTPRVVGQIQSENNGTTGQAVSTLGFVVNGRSETRGDGHFREFLYGNGQIASWSDYLFHFAGQQYDPTTRFLSSTTDRNGHTTTFVSDPKSGNITSVTFPATPEDTPPGTPTGTIAYTYGSASCPDPNNRDGNNPYYLYSATNERGYSTIYLRDPTKRISEIHYPDGGVETFGYNNFNEVLSHRLTSGGLETFTYDGNGRRLTYCDPYHPAVADPNHPEIPVTSAPSMSYGYDVRGRVSSVTDARGNTTNFEYNLRGQVITVTLPPDPVDGLPHTIQKAYNVDGTLQSATDELNHTTSYIYDDYKRPTSVTDPLNHTTQISYALDWVNPLVHTTRSVKYVVSPMNKNIVFDYDANFRKIDQVAAFTTPDEAWTLFGYDLAGNLTSVQDPRGNITTIGYDARNRRMSATAPTPFNDQTTSWQYDEAGNVRFQIRADGSHSEAQYDSMSRAADSYGFANEHTHYDHDLAGSVWQMIDAKGATYGFGHDLMNRKTSAAYPVDATLAARSEGWHYDTAGNLDQYINAAGQTKTLTYDNRNRPYDSSWNSGGGPLISTRFDAASRLSSITTNNGETIVTFGYDDANRQISEVQTVAGFAPRLVQTSWDDDGRRASLSPAGVYTLSYDYTQRGQLANIYVGGAAPWFAYGYDLAGNMIKRQDVLNGVNDSTNIMDGGGVSQYDALNRPMMWEQTGTLNGVSNSEFARSHFNYDSLSRLTASWRDEQSGKGEWFGYDATGQLTGVSYNADGVSSGNPQNASRAVSYTMTPDTLNRSSMNDSGEVSNYTPNALNQYESVAGGGMYYDGNFNLMWTGGFSAGYDSANHLTAIGSGEDYGEFTYDGLGRCLKRTIDWETTLITYDGWKPTVEWDEWNNLKAWNIYGPGPDEILYRHDAYLDVDLRYHLDRMGNVAFLLDGDGDGIERYTYDAFGSPTVTDWNGENARPYSWYGNRFMFTGREYFPELGLYDDRNRFYHPVLGRFLQSDPIGFGGGDANFFRYCGGDPINRSDPSGLDGPPVPKKPLEATTSPVIVSASPLGPAPAAVPFGPSGGITFTGRSFFQGVERPNGDFLDTIPADAANNIVRAPPLGTPFFPPGMFPPGYLPGPPSFPLSGGGTPWDPLGEAMDTFRILVTPAAGLVRVFQNGVTITENGGLGEAVQQQLTLNSAGITYRVGFGPGVGAGLSVTSAVVQSGQVTGPNVQGSVSGGYFFGGAFSGTIGNGPTAYRGGVGFGIGFGTTVTYGQTVFVPWPWNDDHD
jgi:RHS repeat-associated protein